MSGPNPNAGRSIEFATGSSTGTSHLVASFRVDPQILNRPARPPVMSVDVPLEPLNEVPMLSARWSPISPCGDGRAMMTKVIIPETASTTAAFAMAR